MTEIIQAKFKKYLDINKDINTFRKKVSENKKVLQSLEQEIQDYMLENDMTSIQLNDGEILLYDRKVSQSFKKESISECLKTKLKCDEDKADDIAQSILTNKVFKIESKIKVNLKKNK